MEKSIYLKNLQILNLCFMFLFGLLLLCFFLDESFVSELLFVVISSIYLFLLGVVLTEEFKDKRDRSNNTKILKVVTVLLSVLVLFMFILYVIGVLCSVSDIIDVFEHIIPVTMMVQSLVAFSWILLRCRDYDKRGIILIRSKHYLAIIDPRRRLFTYKNDTISIDTITDIEVCFKTRQILKSNFDSSMKSSGLLVIGQGAQTTENKKTLESEDFSVIIKTRDIYHPVILIPANYESCLKVAESCHILRKRSMPSDRTAEDI